MGLCWICRTSRGVKMSKRYVDKVRIFLANVQDSELTFNFWHEYGCHFNAFNASCKCCEYHTDSIFCVEIYRLRKVIK